MPRMKSYGSVDAYIADYPPETRKILQKTRQLIKSQASEAAEKISYGIPTFTLGGKNFIHFAAYSHHFAIYPLRAGVAPFDDELRPYHSGTATIKFPLNEPIPWLLVRKIVKFKIAELKVGDK